MAIAARGGLYDPAVGRLRHAATAAPCTLAVLGLLLLAGCGQDRDPLPGACVGRPEAMLSTLRAGPPVRLDGGARLSGCVSAARTDGDLQSLGLLFVRVADALRAQATSDPQAAFALGYLSGAVARGARTNHGRITAQLARRVDQLASLPPGARAASLAALARGRQAGERDG